MILKEHKNKGMVIDLDPCSNDLLINIGIDKRKGFSRLLRWNSGQIKLVISPNLEEVVVEIRNELDYPNSTKELCRYGYYKDSKEVPIGDSDSKEVTWVNEAPALPLDPGKIYTMADKRIDNGKSGNYEVEFSIFGPTTPTKIRCGGKTLEICFRPPVFIHPKRIISRSRRGSTEIQGEMIINIQTSDIMVEERGELVIYQFEKKELYSWKLPFSTINPIITC